MVGLQYLSEFKSINKPSSTNSLRTYQHQQYWVSRVQELSSNELSVNFRKSSVLTDWYRLRYSSHSNLVLDVVLWGKKSINGNPRSARMRDAYAFAIFKAIGLNFCTSGCLQDVSPSINEFVDPCRMTDILSCFQRGGWGFDWLMTGEDATHLVWLLTCRPR